MPLAGFGHGMAPAPPPENSGPLTLSLLSCEAWAVPATALPAQRHHAMQGELEKIGQSGNGVESVEASATAP